MRRHWLTWLLVFGSGLTWSARAEESTGLVSKPITAEDRRHWAFVPPVRPEVPEVANAEWVRNPIDAFILAELEAFGLEPAPEADRPTLLRRLSFDLTGLPPTPEELDEFLADTAPDAYETVVDRLLASLRYGERWAQHWLDLARYADSDGFELDHTRPDAWRYRDWVVEALNRDLPYDAFVRLQLAGDEVAPGDPWAFLATGFNRCYPDMVDINDQGLRRQNALDDITETTGLVFLGLTVGCAQCHDHKFDPIRQTDYYRLQAFFTPARFRDDYIVASAEEQAEHRRQTEAHQTELSLLRSLVLALEAPIRAVEAPGLPAGANDREQQALRTPWLERTPDEIRLVFEARAKDDRLTPERIEQRLGPRLSWLRQRALGRIDHLVQNPPPPLPRARGLDESGTEAPPTFLRIRGEYENIGPEVRPGVPVVLAGSEADAEVEILPTAATTGRRRALADWLTRPDHPLTSRVMVNRLWQQYFGRGIVASPSDFGVIGIEPSHPELLDWLAVEFVERGWSLKAMHRLIVTSASYRQSTRAQTEGRDLDPENVLVGRQTRRRLDGEAIRDTLLFVSGQLNPAMGGPGVFPDLPPELTRLSSQGAVWPVSPRPQDRNRRSLYVFVRRNLRYPFFEAFDRPDTNASCPQRAVTTIAPQALSLLNSPLAEATARAMADRIACEAGPDRDARITRAYRLALGRAPDDAERRLARQFLRAGPPDALRHFCLALININEFIYIE